MDKKGQDYARDQPDRQTDQTEDPAADKYEFTGILHDANIPAGP